MSDQRDPRWERVRGTVQVEESSGLRYIEIEVRQLEHRVGERIYLHDNHPAEFGYALDRIVRNIDEAMHS